MKYLKLKRARVIISLLFFVITLSIFLDIYESYADASIRGILFLQFMPSLIKFISTLTIGAIGFFLVIALSAFMGRIYCSSICPLGILQDGVAWLAKQRSSKKFFYKKKKGYPFIRYALLGLTSLAILFSLSPILSFLDPYSNFGRIASYLIRPLYVLINNTFALLLQYFEVYSLNLIKLVVVNWSLLAVSIGILATITIMAYKRGRLFCNTLCPVGTLLGLFSHFAYLKININSEACTRCGLCIGTCKSECIDLKTQSVDHTRCVSCFNCLTVCRDSAIHFNAAPAPQQSDTDKSRRRTALTIFTLLLSKSMLATARPEKSTLLRNKKDQPVAPPGSISIKRFNEMCTACGLCVAACPTQVLQPAIRQYGLAGFMQPHMDYLTGFCNFDCLQCGSICPTGAILPISVEEKHLTQLGKAVFVKENCVVYTDGTDCGACAEHCPTKAVNMISYEGNLLIPELDQTICIGCGACEYPCPLEAPYKAIYVNGHAVHQAAEPPKNEASLKPVEDDFPF